jgi:hypothetical protein
VRNYGKMDRIIMYESFMDFLKNTPTHLPCPDFTKLRTLQKHMASVLKQLVCPQSGIHGWLGLVLLPMYTLFLSLLHFLPQFIWATWWYTLNLRS